MLVSWKGSDSADEMAAGAITATRQRGHQKLEAIHLRSEYIAEQQLYFATVALQI